MSGVQPLRRGMKRICIYCQTWESGGIEAFISNTLSHMDLSGLEIEIVAEALRRSVFTEELEAKGVVFHELSGSPRRIVGNYRRFSKLVSMRRYDVLHFNLFQALPMVCLLPAKREGVPIRIAHSHNTMLRQSRTRAVKMRIHRIASYLFSGIATDWWACSDAAARFMFPDTRSSGEEYRIIPNGICLNRFVFNVAERERMRKRLNLEGTFVIGNVGRLCFQKNQTFLLDIFSRIYAEEPSARLLLVGEGEALAALKEQAGRLSISNAVIFFGNTSEVEKLLWAMDVFVFPSIFEGLGIAAVEAQAAGLPTLCSDRVPQEALASSLAQQISLDAPLSQWGDAIMDAQRQKTAVDTVRQLEEHGFDVKTVSAEIRGVYCR